MTTIRCPLNEAALISVNRLAISGAEGDLLYSQLEQGVAATAALLRERGVRPGDCVGIRLNTNWKMLTALLAIIRVDGIACPLDGLQAHELDEVLAHTRCRTVIAGDEAIWTERVVTCWPEEELIGYAALFKKQVRVELSLDADVCVGVRVGTPAGAPTVFTMKSMYYGARSLNAALHLHSDDHCYIPGPFSDPGTLLFCIACIMAGAAIVFPGSPKNLAEDLDHYQITRAMLGSQALESLAAAADDCALAYPALQSILMPCDNETTRHLARTRPDMRLVFTEALPPAAQCLP